MAFIVSPLPADALPSLRRGGPPGCQAAIHPHNAAQYLVGGVAPPPAAAAAAPLTARRPPPPASPPSSALRESLAGRDIAALVALLDPDAVITSDGGGQATAARHPVEGTGLVSRVLAGIAARAPDLAVAERTVNGQPGLIAQRGGTTVTVLAFGIEGDRITRIWAIRNPDKLRAWSPGRTS